MLRPDPRVWAWLTALVLPLFGGGQAGDAIASLEVLSSVDKLRPGQEHRIAVEIRIAAPFHINASQPKDEAMIPTRISLSGPAGVTFSQVEYPTPVARIFGFSPVPLEVYEGTIRIFTTMTVSKDFTGKEVTVGGVLEYQACDDTACLPPAELEFRHVFPVAGPGERGVEIHRDVFTPTGPEGAPQEKSPVPENQAQAGSRALESVGKAPKEGVPVAEEGAFAVTLRERGLLLSFVLVFLGGLGLSLTPCVYPLIPITIGYFGGQAAGRKGRVVFHAVLYVLGMALTYSALGTVAALTGSLFGAALQSPVVLVLISLVMIALALSMFGLYEFRLPSSLTRLGGGSRKGYLGTLFMGLTVGIVAAPCIGPFVLGLLTYVGERGDVALGFLMFFILALGLGIPFLFLAVFSGSLDRLPRSGLWMVWVRKIFGVVLIAMAAYFLRPLFPSTLHYHLTLSLVFFAGGVYLAWVEPTRMAGKVFAIVRQAVGVCFFAAALVVAVQGIQGYVEDRLDRVVVPAGRPGAAAAEKGISWSMLTEEALERAKAQSLPVLVDFYADWCIPCKELDRFTFSDPEVVAMSRRFVMLKADLTSSRDPEANRLKKTYRIKGVPTLVFLMPDGREAAELRVVGFVKKEKLLARMAAALDAAK